MNTAQLAAAVTAVEEGYAHTSVASQAWIDAVARALQPVLDMGEGILGWCYDAADLASLKLDHITHLNLDPRILGAVARADQDPRNSVAIRRSHYRTPAGPFSVSLGSHYSDFTPAWTEHLGPLGISDMLVVNAMNFGYRGCAFSAPSRRPLAAEYVRDAFLSRVASHLVCAYRLHLAGANQAHATSAPEAVLEPSGKIQHLEGAAKDATAQAQLQRAVDAMELARGKMRKAEPQEALMIWKAMVAGRWTLVDQFESDGRRYVVAKVNSPASGAISKLSERESQVVALASLGRSNKVIAYELGLAEGTVATLLTRSRKKLGAATFDDLLLRMSNRWESGAKPELETTP